MTDDKNKVMINYRLEMGAGSPPPFIVHHNCKTAIVSIHSPIKARLSQSNAENNVSQDMTTLKTSIEVNQYG